MLMDKIRIITYHRAVNNGALLQALGLIEHLQKMLPNKDIKIIDCRSLRMELMEFLKIFKPSRKKPFFHLKRFIKFRKFQKTLPLENIGHYSNLSIIIKKINRQNYRAIFVGSDSIWKFSSSFFLPKIPNIYWLSPKISTKTISYAASAYQYQEELLPEYRGNLLKQINAFDLVSVRDTETKELILEIGYKKTIYQIPDPAFFYQVKDTGVRQKLIRFGLKPEKPIFAIITGYTNDRIAEITTYFRQRNYQVIALSIYNPLADFNLGDELTPDEWAEAFKYVSFCLTDRFHGAIFCLKNQTSFIAIETKATPANKSKKYQLLSDFELIKECYLNIFKEGYQFEEFIDRYKNIRLNWQKNIKPKIDYGFAIVEEKSKRFDQKILKIID
jgi:polysaccharide pyruvyl transferase WcaK-like protein